MRVDVFSIFPELVDGFCSGSLLGKARQSGVLDLRVHDLREVQQALLVARTIKNGLAPEGAHV